MRGFVSGIFVNAFSSYNYTSHKPGPQEHAIAKESEALTQATTFIHRMQRGAHVGKVHRRSLSHQNGG